MKNFIPKNSAIVKRLSTFSLLFVIIVLPIETLSWHNISSARITHVFHKSVPWDSQVLLGRGKMVAECWQWHCMQLIISPNAALGRIFEEIYLIESSWKHFQYKIMLKI